TRPIKLDFRIIAATNQDLTAMIKRGAFRADLFYRLNIFHLQVPSLREIREDIPRMAYYFLSLLRKKRRASPTRISQEAMALLKAYPWPGNARELKNTIERAMHVAEGGQITVDDLPNRIRGYYQARNTASSPGLLRQVLEDAERRAIAQALRFTGGNKAQAARILGIHRTALYQKLKRYQIDV
ncbi:MAG: sigma-54-dependent Fis family transcriptional regulator, partial [Deltaproteobacteria bacterium]